MSATTICRNPARIARWLVMMGLAAFACLPTTAFAQTAVCGPDVKEAIVKKLAGMETASDAEKAAAYDDVYKQYQYCSADAKSTSSTFYAAAEQCGASISNLGSLYFEEMSCVGYDPQRRQFAAPIRIKQVGGFGGTPLPGSREYVLHCVVDATGVFQPVGRDSVHLSNALPGQVPTWQFAVITSANENLQTIQPMNNTSKRARSILSWGLPPTNCNYTPIWGNAVNYRIRLDQ